MARVSLEQAVKGLEEMGWELQPSSRAGFKYQLVSEEKQLVIWFENGSKVVKYYKENRTEPTAEDGILTKIIEDYLHETDFDTKGEYFYMMDAYLRKYRSQLSPDVINRAENLIVLG